MRPKALIVALLAFSQLTCHQAILLAPPGSTLSLFANPPFIPAYGGVSVISALVIEPAGTPVADGTVVQFFTTLGSIQEQAKTNDGVARVNLVSDSRSGVATVTAFSGGGSSSSGTTPGSVPTTGGGPLSNSVLVGIGSVLPKLVIVTANPIRIVDSRSTHVFANVSDERGNPVPNVPVIFTVDAQSSASLNTEHMDSAGSPIFTDMNGRSEDVMRTKWGFGDGPKTVTVRASVATGASAALSGTVVITIN